MLYQRAKLDQLERRAVFEGPAPYPFNARRDADRRHGVAPVEKVVGNGPHRDEPVHANGGEQVFFGNVDVVCVRRGARFVWHYDRDRTAMVNDVGV